MRVLVAATGLGREPLYRGVGGWRLAAPGSDGRLPPITARSLAATPSLVIRERLSGRATWVWNPWSRGLAPPTA